MGKLTAHRRLGAACRRRHLCGMPAARGLTDRARCPNRGSRASCRAGSWAETVARCDAGDAPSAGMASARDTWASVIVMLPLRRLQLEQAATTLIQVVWPPRERGTR